MRTSARKPKIGVNLDIRTDKTTNYVVNRAYIRAIIESGGMPIIIPPCDRKMMRSYARTLDGMLFIGGPDYSPALYGETDHPTIKHLDPERENFDLTLFAYLHKRRIPILGICGGMQLINIVLGGSLIQDIDTHRPGSGAAHSTGTIPAAYHPVDLVKGSRLATIYGATRIETIVSSHHQSIKNLGRDLILQGISAADGIVEAIALVGDDYLVGVQWHPEQDYPTNKPLFDSLITAAGSRRQK